MKKKGFSFYCTEEQINDYKKLSAKDKLNWLQEDNRFIHRIMPSGTKEIREMFRRGEL